MHGGHIVNLIVFRKAEIVQPITCEVADASSFQLSAFLLSSAVSVGKEQGIFICFPNSRTNNSLFIQITQFEWTRNFARNCVY